MIESYSDLDQANPSPIPRICRVFLPIFLKKLMTFEPVPIPMKMDQITYIGFRIFVHYSTSYDN
jgi:hypothetical protein